MKHTVLIAALVAMTAGALPASARADCLDDVIAECDTAIPVSSLLGTPFRGWCYLSGLADCAAS